MKTRSDTRKIRRIQVKIISALLAAPFCKHAVYNNTEFDKVFHLKGDEKNNLDIAWALLKDDNIVYADYHEIGINADSLSFASRFIESE